jgi:hypothetical protein
VLEAGFAIAAVAAREAFDLVVAGVETDGAVVVERWRVDPRGARSGAEPTRVRTTLLRTRQIGDVRALVVDPDGRWVLVLAGDGERLLQVPLQTQGRVLALFEAEVLPALRTACGTFVGEHVGGSRVVAFESPGGDGVERAVLVDRDRDGHFDEVLGGDADAWAAAGFAGSVWTEQRFVALR